MNLEMNTYILISLIIIGIIILISSIIIINILNKIKNIKNIIQNIDNEKTLDELNKLIFFFPIIYYWIKIIYSKFWN